MEIFRLRNWRMVNEMISGDIVEKNGVFTAAPVLNISKDAEDTMIVETPGAYFILEPKRELI